MVISLLNLAKILPRLASMAPLECLTLAHLLCPAIKTKLCDGFHLDGRAVTKHFGDAGSKFSGVVAHTDDGIGAELVGVRNHFPKSVVAGLLASSV